MEFSHFHALSLSLPSFSSLSPSLPLCVPSLRDESHVDVGSDGLYTPTLYATSSSSSSSSSLLSLPPHLLVSSQTSLPPSPSPSSLSLSLHSSKTPNHLTHPTLQSHPLKYPHLPPPSSLSSSFLSSSSFSSSSSSLPSQTALYVSNSLMSSPNAKANAGGELSRKQSMSTHESFAISF